MSSASLPTQRLTAPQENAWPGQHQACGAVKFLDSNPHDQWREQEYTLVYSSLPLVCCCRGARRAKKSGSRETQGW
jgi:hypothetical protein